MKKLSKTRRARKVRTARQNKKSFPLLHQIAAFSLLVFFLAASIFLIRQHSLRADANEEVFSFTAGGDHGATAGATSSLQSIAASGANFHLAVGDLSYDHVVPESAWCSYVKSHVGDTFPFQLIAGNHEDDGRVDGFIDNFSACLPDRMGSTGTYGKEYYFDYPANAPLARVIMIAADLYVNGQKYDYSVGNPHYTWLSNTIDAARAQGIKWVVVGMHKNCLTMGGKPTCSVGTDLANLLLEKKVDLIIQGHDHNYQRSKQLALSAACPGITVDGYNASCVVDDGSDGQYTKGNGPITVIAGSFGSGLVSINPSDAEAPYFASWMGNNSNPSLGYVKFSVSNSELSGQYIPVSLGTFVDSFKIIDTSAPASPTPTPDPFEPTPTDTAVPTPTTAPPTSTPVPTPLSGTIQLNPVADTYVSKSKPNSNYGTATTLQVDGSSKKVPTLISYLRFDLTSLSGKSIRSAKLRVKVTNSSSVIQNVKSVSSTTWGETQITYNTRPAFGTTVTSFTGGSSGTWKEIDITAYISGKAGELVSLGIDSIGSDGWHFSSRNSATDKPILVITYE